MPDDRLATALRRALLALRVTLGLFLLQWGVEKFVVPESTVGIWGHFYGLALPAAAGYLFGAAEIAIALCLFLGMFRTPAYGAALALPESECRMPTFTVFCCAYSPEDPSPMAAIAADMLSNFNAPRRFMCSPCAIGRTACQRRNATTVPGC